MFPHHRRPQQLVYCAYVEVVQCFQSWFRIRASCQVFSVFGVQPVILVAEEYPGSLLEAFGLSKVSRILRASFLPLRFRLLTCNLGTFPEGVRVEAPYPSVHGIRRRLRRQRPHHTRPSEPPSQHFGRRQCTFSLTTTHRRSIQQHWGFVL